MKRIFFAVIASILLAVAGAVAQENSNYDKFLKLLEQKDTIAMKNLLDGWDNSDPEYYVSAFNFWLLQARDEILIVNAGQPDSDGETVLLYDKDNKQAGYIQNDVSYDEALLNKAVTVLEEGISKYPDRLDMRIGLATTYFNAKKTDKALSVIKGILDRAKENGNVWLWKRNEPLENTPQSMTDSMQGYVNKFITSASPTEVNDLVEMLVDYDPKNPVFLSNKASLLYNDWKFEEALKLYEEAFTYDPSDMLIAGNIAFGYLDINRFDEAKPYLELVAQNSKDVREKVWAKEMLSSLDSLKNATYNKLDIKSLKDYATNNREEFDQLYARYLEADITLTSNETFLLCYASAFTEHNTKLDVKDINSFIREEDDEKVYQKGKELLKSSPFSLKLLYYTAIAAYKLKKDDAESLAVRLNMVFEAINSTGNGCSQDCPMAVTSIDDEYFILDLFGKTSVHKQSTLRPKDGKGPIVDKMDFMTSSGAKTRYFNVDILFSFYNQLFD